MLIFEIEVRQADDRRFPGSFTPIVFTEVERAAAQAVQRLMKREHREAAREKAIAYFEDNNLTAEALAVWR
jgi:hypothetical protein